MTDRILVMTAVEAEREAVIRGLGGDVRFVASLCGVGPASAAARTAAALARGGYSLVISAGIAGGFVGQAEPGGLVVASEIVNADLGAETPDGGFIDLDGLGFGSARFAVEAVLAGRVHESLLRAGLPSTLGPVITVSTVTGSVMTACRRAAAVQGATAEGMEGGGVAAAASVFGLPMLEIRAISNAVGPRDRSAWRIKEALFSLEKAFEMLPEVLFPS